MMELRIWILILLSPFLMYAIYLILEESRDPLMGFHEKFREARLGSQTGGVETFGGQAPRNSLGHSKFQIRSAENGDFSSRRISRGKLTGFRIRDLYLTGTISITLIWVALGLSPNIVFLLNLISVSFWIRASREDGRRNRKITELQDAELPSFVEILAIVVAAGESPSSAIVKVTERAHGVLADNFIVISDQLKKGRGLIPSLDAAASNSRSQNFKRFCDSLIVAIERGTPIVGVLQNQVIELRNDEKSRLLKAAGRSEISLMIPIVFLILPISILFALWPSFVTLGRSFGS